MAKVQKLHYTSIPLCADDILNIKSESQGTHEAHEVLAGALANSKKTFYFFVLVGFVVLVIIGLVEINRRNILQVNVEYYLYVHISWFDIIALL